MRRPALLLLIAMLALAASGAPAAAAPATKTVAVDCAAGDSIMAALAKKADELVIEITGLCAENVQVRRDRVTFRGTDPSVDGIEATATDDPYGAALLIREARFITIENLKLTGGTSTGLRVENARRNVEASNCRFEDNGSWGVVAVGGLVEIVDSVATGNGTGGLIASEGSILLCNDCTVFDNPAPGEGLGVASSLASSLALTNGSVRAQTAVDVGSGSTGTFRDTVLTGEDQPSGWGLAVSSSGNGSVTVRSSTLDGSLYLDNQSQLALVSVDQIGNPVGNIVYDQARIQAAGSTPSGPTNLIGTTTLAQWANGTFAGQTNLGDLVCIDGADAKCFSGVTKTSSTCGLCP